MREKSICLLEWCCKRIDDLAQLGRDPGQCHLLEGSVGVPFLADGSTQTVLVLSPGLERVWDLVHSIRCRLLVALLVDDHVGQLGVLAFAQLNTVAGLRLLHNDILSLLGALSTPSSLKYVESDDHELVSVKQYMSELQKSTHKKKGSLPIQEESYQHPWASRLRQSPSFPARTRTQHCRWRKREPPGRVVKGQQWSWRGP